MGTQLRDIDVRAAAKARLLGHARRCPDTLVIDELGLDHGAARIDIAVINGHIRGIEIKAEADTIERLPRQVAAYGRVVDMASLIVDERHIGAALPLLPDWWGVVAVTRAANGAVAFRRLRQERINREVDRLAIARLLWRNEVVALLAAAGRELKVLERQRRAELYAELIRATSQRRLRSVVRETLKGRDNWRDQTRPLSCDGSFPPTATC